MAYTWQAEDSIEPISSSTIEAIANIGTYSVATGCTISYGSGTMICTVAAGNVVFSGALQTVVGNTVTLVADASNPRWTWIAIDSTGVAVMVAGTAAASPSVPELGNYVGIALVKVEAAQTSATAITYKLDKRVLSPAAQRVMTTTGDVVYASAAFTPARLAIGSASQVLTVSGGIPAWATAAVEAIDYQAFAASGTWTKPAGATAKSFSLIRAWGAGGGGGGGRGNNAGNYRAGGSAGGAGGLTQAWFLTSLLASTETVTIGAAGASGAGGSLDIGVDGSVGGTTTFGSWASAFGGGQGGGGGGSYSGTGGGGGGSLGAGTMIGAGTGLFGGYGGLPRGHTGVAATPTVYGLDGGGALGGVVTITGFSATLGGGGGGSSDASSLVTAGSAGGSSLFGGGGGGGGGAMPTGNTEYAGGAGGASNRATSGGGGAGGAVNGGAGGAGTTGVGTAWGGYGGGGGGAQDSGTGGVGGAGGGKGGGGGGGGPGTTTGGAGGAGGIGWMEVITIL